jgi:hypothetical protein
MSPGSRTVCLFLVVAAVVTSGVATGGAVSASTPDTQVNMELSDAEGAVGDTVTVRLSLSGGEVAGYQAAVEYDPEVVSFESATGGDFARPQVNDDDDRGLVTLSQASSGVVGTDLVAAELTFRIEAAGSTKLELVDTGRLRTLASAEDTESFPTTVTGGSITAKNGDTGGIVTQPDNGTSDDSGQGGVATTESDDDAATEGTETKSHEQETDDETRNGERNTTDSTDGADGAANPRDDEAPAESDSDELPGFGVIEGAVTLLIVAAIALGRR